MASNLTPVAWNSLSIPQEESTIGNVLGEQYFALPR
jgi:hypothetical protein